MSQYDWYWGGFNTITGGTGGINGADGWYFYEFPLPQHMMTVNDLPAGVVPTDQTASGGRSEGLGVSLVAGTRAGFEFSHWSASPSVIFADDSNPNTTFIMPSNSVVITANWTTVTDTGTPPPPTQQQLVAPIISIVGTTLSWSAVENASGYRVYIDLVAAGDIITSTSFDLADLDLGVGVYSVRVRAIGFGNFANSQLSSVMNFVVEGVRPPSAGADGDSQDVENEVNNKPPAPPR